MNVRKSLLVISTAGVLGVGLLTTTPVALARGSKSEGMQHFAQRAQRIEHRLDQAEKNGKITADQKAAIEAKLQELKQFHETLKNMTPQQRRDAMKQKMEELKEWAKSNNIPFGFMMPAKVHKK